METKICRKTTYASKRPKETLRNMWDHKNSDVSSVPRETESNLKTWNFHPIPSESRNWPDENLQGQAVHTKNSRILKHDAQPSQTHHSITKKGHQEDVQKCRSLIASKEFNNSPSAFPKPPERCTTLYHLRYLCMRWRGAHATTEGCGAPKRSIICMNWGSRSKIHKLYVVMILKKIKCSIFDLTQLEKVHTKASSKIERLGRSVSQRRIPRETEKPPLTMMRSQLMEQVPARKIKTDMERWSLRIFRGVLYIHSPNPDDELKICFVQMVMEWWMIFSRQRFFRQFFSGFRTHVVATTVCTTGVYIHSPVARTFFWCTHTPCILHTSSCVSHTRMAQVSVKKKCLHMCRFSPSRLHPPFLVIHPSLLFPHGHFETTPDYDFTDDSDIHKFLSYFPVLKPQDMRHSAPASRSLATWPSQMQTQVMSPKSSTRSITSADSDTVLINDLNHNFSNFSKTTNENTRQIGVPTVLWILCFARSHDDFALCIGSKESMQSGNRC